MDIGVSHHAASSRLPFRGRRLGAGSGRSVAFGPTQTRPRLLPFSARNHASCGFSLLEVLVCISIVTVLIALLVPALSHARSSARTTLCLSNQRQLSTAWINYAGDYRDYSMPLAYWNTTDIGADGEQVFWWGTHGTTAGGVDHTRGFISPYIDATLTLRSVFDCPEQPWGTYRPQGPSRQVTSTYGYNGYYLSPSRTPGWGESIGIRPWRRLFEIQRPADLFVFADTLVAMGRLPSNCALLDPPMLFAGGGSTGSWYVNNSPTTAFRHSHNRQSGSVATARADGGARLVRSRPEWLTVDPVIGSVGTDNDPHYVPDWRDWP